MFNQVERKMSYSIKPEDHELSQARQVVENTIDSVKYTLEKEKALSLHLGHASKAETGEFGAFGHAENSENARLMFNTSSDNWKESLKELTVDVYGQAWFYENEDNHEFVWQQLLASITGLLLIEKVSNGREPDYNGLQEEWSEKKENLSEQLVKSPENFSWQLKLILGRKLLEEHELEDFPDLKRSNVIEAGDEAFQ